MGERGHMRIEPRRHPAEYSAWHDTLSSELKKLRDLQPVDDSWSPHPPSERALQNALALVDAIRVQGLPLAIMSAGPDGVICLEWRKPDHTVAFYLMENGAVEALAVYPNRTPLEISLDKLEQANELLATFVK
jgi:hypothetical protein